MLEIRQVTIIGTGLLGASLALALRGRGYGGRIVGVGRRVQTLEQARGLGCFDELTVSTEEALDGGAEGAGEPGGAHVVVLAAPLGYFREIFTKLSRCTVGGLIVTDVGSTKASVCALAEELLAEPTLFVGSHPMAGGERHGPEAADAGLFEGRPCVVTPGGDTDEHALELVKEMWRVVGMRVKEMDPVGHDRAVALVSHLPHAVASMLVKAVTVDGGDALDVASTGFADTTRIAAGDPGVWVDIFQTNCDAVTDSVKRMIDELERFKKVLMRKDSGALKRLLEGAKQERDAWGSGWCDERGGGRGAGVKDTE
jgi:prephenate dehydrogenase